MPVKNFLLQECENVKVVLEETLRYKYGLEGSKEFFEECEARLSFITAELSTVDEVDYQLLGEYCQHLNNLSALISRIERSSLGEYSWPFVEELKKISTAICTEATLTNANTPPLVHVLSDGGLGAYRIYPERKRPSSGQTRILTIVFPRTLKDFVLLHPILGHEIGHAVWQTSKHQARLQKIVIEEIIQKTTKIFSKDATANWLYSTEAPSDLKDVLIKLDSYGINESNFFEWANWEAWLEEILCDLIGLLIFGPSFVAAHCELLYATSPTGAGFSQQHPPACSRVNMILSAATILGYDDTSTFSPKSFKDASIDFWNELHSHSQSDDWSNLFTQEQLTNVLQRISTLLKENDPSHYPSETPEILSDLFNQLNEKVPPVGFKIYDDDELECKQIDFRHILYAGWIVRSYTPDMPFKILNQLCEHGIMQQRGIDMYLEVKK